MNEDTYYESAVSKRIPWRRVVVELDRHGIVCPTNEECDELRALGTFHKTGDESWTVDAQRVLDWLGY